MKMSFPSYQEKYILCRKQKEVNQRNERQKSSGFMETQEKLDISSSKEKDEEVNICLVADKTSEKEEDYEVIIFHDLTHL
ncbi:hypothetical protein CR513_59241, partial [Mucuna pruriens]